MLDIASLLTLQARSRRNARKGMHRLRQARRAAVDVQRAVDEANRAHGASNTAVRTSAGSSRG
jgi:hypothetical protein